MKNWEVTVKPIYADGGIGEDIATATDWQLREAMRSAGEKADAWLKRNQGDDPEADEYVDAFDVTASQSTDRVERFANKAEKAFGDLG